MIALANAQHYNIVCHQIHIYYTLWITMAQAHGLSSQYQWEKPKELKVQLKGLP